MSDATGPADHHDDARRVRPVEDDAEVRVTPIELFFDLVFVFALTQVSALIEDDLTWTGVLRGLAVLTVLWWAWTGYVWLTNSVEPEEGYPRLVLLVAMTAMLVAGVAVPQAFGEWSIVFGTAYLVVRLLHVLLYLAATREEPAVFRAVLRLTPGMLVGGTLVFVAGFLDAGPARAVLWTVAIAVDFAAPLVSGPTGWNVRPAHFAERHGLAIVIALGESVIALGLAASEVGVDAAVLLAAMLAMVAIAALWWLYFGVASIVGARRLAAESGAARAAMARDSYSYLHLPMIFGIVLLALGTHEALLHIGEPLDTIPRSAVLGGVAVYLFAHLGFRYRNTRSIGAPRTIAAAALLLAIPATVAADATAVLGVAAGVLVLTIAWETVRNRGARHEVRLHGAGGDWVREKGSTA